MRCIEALKVSCSTKPHVHLHQCQAASTTLLISGSDFVGRGTVQSLLTWCLQATFELPQTPPTSVQVYLKQLLAVSKQKGASDPVAAQTARVAVRCMAGLLAALPHFNFSGDLLQVWHAAPFAISADACLPLVSPLTGCCMFSTLESVQCMTRLLAALPN